MTALALPRPKKLWLPRFEPWRLLKPLKLEGQFAPRQLLQFGGGLLAALPVGGPVTSLSFITSEGSDTDTITIPAAAAAGDIAVWGRMAYRSGGGSGASPPAGWNTIFTRSSAFTLYNIYLGWKSLTVEDLEATFTGDASVMTSGNNVVLIFRPSSAPANTINDAGGTDLVSDTDPANLVSPGSGKAVPCIVLGQAATSGTAAFNTNSPALTVVSSGTVALGYKIYNTGDTPVDHTIGMADLGAMNDLTVGVVLVS